LAGIKIIQFDAFGALESIVASPNGYRLQNVTDACIRPGTAPPSRCENPDQYLFWDGIHPTRAGHAVIAFLVGKTLVGALMHDD
jgi:outer membrane lipase/esterase